MAVQFNITLTAGAETQGTMNNLLIATSAKPHQECLQIIHYFDAINGGNRRASFTAQVTSGDQVAASGTLTLSGHSSTSDTFLVNGVTFTCVATGATNNQYNVGTTSINQATDIASAINASTTALVQGAVSATATGSVVTVTALAAGVSGNWVTTAKGTDAASVQTWSGARLTAGAAPTSVTNGGTYHCGQ